MIAAPSFTSLHEFRSRIDDADFWWPYLAEILRRHGLLDAGHEALAGFNATYPTFVCGDVVVKLFGYAWWRASHAAEHAALTLLASDSAIAAPRLLGAGRLSDDPAAAWPYLITTRVPGVAWFEAGLSAEQRLAVAAELGQQVRRVHALAPAGITSDADWSSLDVVAAAERSSLPPQLIPQIDAYLARLDPFDRVVVHGDLGQTHTFIAGGRLVGIIDWGDAIVTDRHYELIHIQQMFGCDRALLRAFLEASDWPLGQRFARQAMGLALYRQAVGLAQHHSMDVFYILPALFPGQDFATLDELAAALFAV